MTILIPWVGGIGTGTADQLLQNYLNQGRDNYSPQNALSSPNAAPVTQRNLALLGDMLLSLISVSQLDSRHSANYAEHALIGGKPRLQWLGDSLDELTLKLLFHRQFCDPKLEILVLKQALARHAAQPLVLGNGDHLGWVVITELSVASQQTADDGTLLACEVDLTLKEHVLPPVLKEQAANKPPLAAVDKNGKPPAKTVKKAATPRPAAAPVARNDPPQDLSWMMGVK